MNSIDKKFSTFVKIAISSVYSACVREKEKSYFDVNNRQTMG